MCERIDGNNTAIKSASLFLRVEFLSPSRKCPSLLSSLKKISLFYPDRLEEDDSNRILPISRNDLVVIPLGEYRSIPGLVIDPSSRRMALTSFHPTKTKRGNGININKRLSPSLPINVALRKRKKFGTKTGYRVGYGLLAIPWEQC